MSHCVNGSFDRIDINNNTKQWLLCVPKNSDLTTHKKVLKIVRIFWLTALLACKLLPDLSRQLSYYRVLVQNSNLSLRPFLNFLKFYWRHNSSDLEVYKELMVSIFNFYHHPVLRITSAVVKRKQFLNYKRVNSIKLL